MCNRSSSHSPHTRRLTGGRCSNGTTLLVLQGSSSSSALWSGWWSLLLCRPYINPWNNIIKSDCLAEMVRRLDPRWCLKQSKQIKHKSFRYRSCTHQWGWGRIVPVPRIKYLAPNSWCVCGFRIFGFGAQLRYAKFQLTRYRKEYMKTMDHSTSFKFGNDLVRWLIKVETTNGEHNKIQHTDQRFILPSKICTIDS
jgi:hypothetical protein